MPHKLSYIIFALLLIITVAVIPTRAQNRPYAPDQILVQVNKGFPAISLGQVLDNQKYTLGKKVVRRLNIYIVKINDSDQLSPLEAVQELRTNLFMKNVQLDHFVSPRQSFPDDPDFGDQWDMHNTGQSGGTIDADIDAPEAWDITTGGITPLGDTIVVAVVDGGCLTSHSDLQENIWTNRHEIPGNGIDDDNNGYVDDIHGWDAYSSDGSVPSDYHGTHVSGTVGALGDNGTYVAGVNWNVKVMPVAGSSSQTSTVLEAYGYVLDQRVLYDSTGGEYGAFVVSTNSSFGIDFADCESGNYPLWNEMYDALGEAGILSATATINSGQNVDVIGDVPTGCSSDWLISVTNTTRTDSKNSGAGYGLTTIDLGAPGTNILSLSSSGATGTSTGTSMATPHVAGAVAFMHAAMASGFASFYKQNPGDGALMVKDIILDGTDPIPDLQGATVSGGRLNLFNSAVLAEETMAADSLDPNPVTNLQADTSLWYQALITWNDPYSLFNGDPITDFYLTISRNDSLIDTVDEGVMSYRDYQLEAGELYRYSFMTHLMSNDSTSVPATVDVIPSGGECLPGDVSLDGEVTIIDFIYFLQYMTESQPLPPSASCQADLDFDGEMTISDLLMTADILLEQE